MSSEFDDVNELINRFNVQLFPMKMRKLLFTIIIIIITDNHDQVAQIEVSFEYFGKVKSRRDTFKKVPTFYISMKSKRDLKRFICFVGTTLLALFLGDQLCILIYMSLRALEK